MNSFSLGSEDCDRPSTAAIAALLDPAGVLIAGTILAWWSDRPPGPLLALDLAAGALSLLLTPLMLWRPAATTAVLTVLAARVALLGDELERVRCQRGDRRGGGAHRQRPLVTVNAHKCQLQLTCPVRLNPSDGQAVGLRFAM